jgi:hypothetical protein
MSSAPEADEVERVDIVSVYYYHCSLSDEKLGREGEKKENSNLNLLTSGKKLIYFYLLTKTIFKIFIYGEFLFHKPTITQLVSFVHL